MNFMNRDLTFTEFWKNTTNRARSFKISEMKNVQNVITLLFSFAENNQLPELQIPEVKDLTPFYLLQHYNSPF